MSEFGIKRLDHHGIVMGIIQDLGIIEQIDSRLGQYKDEKLSVGTRVAALILNGLGFTDQPLSLVPEFFEELPVNHLFGEDVVASDLNRFSLSRALDRVSQYGEATLFAEIAMHACEQAQVNRLHQSMDTTTFSFSGDYKNSETDEVPVRITHGYSKDKRADLKQIVTELIVSHDGGVPLVLKNWDGNASDPIIFQQRSEQLVAAFQAGYVNHITADSKFYTLENSKHWHAIKFTTRAPETIVEVKSIIKQSKAEQEWFTSSDGKTQYIAYDVTHYETQQRWLVCKSESSVNRATKSIAGQIIKEKENIQKTLTRLQSQRFRCEADAELATKKLFKKLKYHEITGFEYKTYERYNQPGNAKYKRPDYLEYQITGSFCESSEKVSDQLHQKSCFVLATNVGEDEISDDSVVQAYKCQGKVESGYRFLKDPQFFANAFFLKSERRISALIMIMTLALLVYSIAQKRLSSAIDENGAEFKNHAGVKQRSLTIRRAFQLFRGVYIFPLEGVGIVIDGLNDLRVKILNLLSGRVLKYYCDGRRCDLKNQDMAS